MIALLISLLIASPFAALFFATGRWYERHQPCRCARVIHLPVRHPSAHHRPARHHVRTVPTSERVPLLYDFEEFNDAS